MISVTSVRDLLVSVSDRPLQERSDLERYDLRRISSALGEVVPAGDGSVSSSRPGRRRHTTLNLLRIAHEAAPKAPQGYRDCVAQPSWFCRHVHDETKKTRMKAIIECLRTLAAGDEESVAALVGAPSIRAIDQLFLEPAEPTPLLETAGLSGAQPASVLKHQLNSLVIQAAGVHHSLLALEVGQGYGDGTLGYRRHGLVVSIEKDDQCFRVASTRVPHLSASFSAAHQKYDPLQSQPTELIDQLRQSGDHGLLPAIMLNASVRETVTQLERSSWRFNWIDVDPKGFAEASGMDVAHACRLGQTQSILCVTNGGAHAERFGNSEQMWDFLTRGCHAVTQGQRRRQRQEVLRRLVETETAQRVRNAEVLGYFLSPVLLYDGRHGSAGIVRSYYLALPSVPFAWRDETITYDEHMHIWVVRENSIAPMSDHLSASPSPNTIPMVSRRDIRPITRALDEEESEWIERAVHARLNYLNSKYGRR